jgi:hypothetical protein
MELKPGDKVRFLNEMGGGIVTGIISKTMVNVAIEEGFEVPVLIKDLLLIEPQGAAGRFFDRQVNVALPDKAASGHEKLPVASETSHPESSEDDRVSWLYRQSGMKTVEGIHLAFAPRDQKWLISGDLDIFLVNNTSYDALHSIYLKETEKDYAGFDYDVIPAYSKMLIESIHREDIEGWCDGVLQVIFHKSEVSQVLSPLHAAFKMKPVRFYRESSYLDFPLIGLKAIMINMGDIAGQVIIAAEEELAKSGLDLAAQQKIMAVAPPALIDLHKTSAREAEVDLHISALRTDYSGLQNSEILNFQLDYFSRMLESAIAFNYVKVVFIHGIGNGTLKSAIRAKLAEYEGIESRSASFASYGNGAIEVTILKNA